MQYFQNCIAMMMTYASFISLMIKWKGGGIRKIYMCIYAVNHYNLLGKLLYYTYLLSSTQCFKTVIKVTTYGTHQTRENVEIGPRHKLAIIGEDGSEGEV